MKIFKNYDKEFEDLQKSLGEIKQQTTDNKVLISLADISSEVKCIRKQNEEIVEELAIIKKLLTDTPTETSEKEQVEEPKLEEIYYGDLAFSKTARKDYKYTFLDEDTFKFKFRGIKSQWYHSIFTMFDVLIVSQLENENTWSSWADLIIMTGLNQSQIKQLAYNVKKGFFDKFDFTDKVTFSKQYGLLYINGKKTNVPIKTARYIVDCMINSNNPMTTLLKLEKSKEISKLMYRIIGANYKNGQLVSILKDNGKVPIENNPQKRKEKAI